MYCKVDTDTDRQTNTHTHIHTYRALSYLIACSNSFINVLSDSEYKTDDLGCDHIAQPNQTQLNWPVQWPQHPMPVKLGQAMWLRLYMS